MNPRFSPILPAVLALICAILGLPARAANYQFLDDEAEPQTDIAFTAGTAASGELTVVFDYRDDKNFYALDLAPHTLALRAVTGGQARPLGSANIAWQPQSRVTLKRRAWLVQVIVDGRVTLTAYDATFNKGRIGSAASGGWSWQHARVQPIEELYFADDFTRAAGQEGEWKEASGQWTLTASSENIQARNVEMSANPFSYQTAAGGRSFAHVGRKFWDNYDAQVSVRPAARGTIGLAVYVQDPNNYLAFEWSAPDSPTARRLVRVVDGKATVLASAPGGFLPRQWYRLGVRTSPGYVEAFIDGTLVFTARNDWFGQGGIGLIAHNVAQAGFDDLRVRAYSYYRQDVATTGGWTTSGGLWRAQGETLNATAKAGEASAARLFLAGRDTWNGYEMSAAAKAGATGACGLVTGYRDDKNYVVFRWAGAGSALPYQGRQQLLRYQDGKATVVSDEPLSLKLDDTGFARIKLRQTPAALTVYANGQLMTELADETIQPGRCGLYAQGQAPSSFRDVVVFFPPEPIPPKVAPRMEEDALMVGWASPSGEWPPSVSDQGTEFWNTGEFFGDSSLEAAWRRSYARGKLDIALRARRDAFDSGYVLSIEQTARIMHLALRRGGTLLKETQFNLRDLEATDTDEAPKAGEAPKEEAPAQPPGTIPLRLELEGRAIVALIGGRPALVYMAPGNGNGSVPTGTGIAARATGFALRTKDLRAASTHRDDYTFTEAPTDWYSPQGRWSVISRWPCYSDWSFFGGTGLNPVLWSKRSYAGDTVVEIYAHNQMDLPKEIGYSNPGNLNITIGGDGKNPSSGYSFIVAGWNNTRTRVFKGAQPLTDNDTNDAHFPRPINHNYTFHKRWYYIRAEVRRAQKDGRSGVSLKLTMDDVPLAEYFDPAPLPGFARGGRVAFWSVDGTLLIARAKIESQSLGQLALPSGLLDAAAPLSPAPAASGADAWVPRPLPMDGLPSAVVERNSDAWTVRNPTAGGNFAVQLVKAGDTAANPKPWKATKDARLDFDIALPPDVKVDLYATVDGVRYVIALTDQGKPDARVQPMGNAVQTAGAGGWRHVSFNLGAALAKLSPDRPSWPVEEVALGTLHGDEYRWLGFGGNQLGAAYRLRGVKLTG